METKNLSGNGPELPPSLGYGMLDRRSVRFENETLLAEYFLGLDGSLVHRIKWRENRCELHTFLHGESLRQSVYRDLRDALLFDCMSWDLSKDKCFLFLADKICDLGNIYVNLPHPDSKRPSLNFFPAAKLFLFALPLVERSEGYLTFLRQVETSPSLRLFRERKGHLMLLDQELRVMVRPIIIAEFVVPLAHLYDAAQAVVAAGIIGNNKYFRLLVNEASEAEHALMLILTGDESSPTYAIIFNETPREKLEELSKTFLLQVETLKMRYQQ